MKTKPKERLYLVKWKGGRDGKVQRYGHVECGLSKQEKAEEARGFLRVADAVLPMSEWIKRDRLIPIELTSKWTHDPETGPVGNDEHSQYVNRMFRACLAAQKHLASGCVEGKLFNLPAADGRAYYVVTEVKGRQVRVEWRGFCPDRWTDAVLGYGGWFPKRVIAPLIKIEEGLRALFSREQKVA